MQYIKEFHVEFSLTTNKGKTTRTFNLNTSKYGNTLSGRERLLLDLHQLVNKIMNEGIMEALPTDQSKPAISATSTLQQ